jgi:hypothetical protein
MYQKIKKNYKKVTTIVGNRCCFRRSKWWFERADQPRSQAPTAYLELQPPFEMVAGNNRRYRQWSGLFPMQVRNSYLRPSTTF